MIDYNYSTSSSHNRRLKVVAKKETSAGAEITAEAELLVLSFMFYVIIWVNRSKLQAHSGIQVSMQRPVV